MSHRFLPSLDALVAVIAAVSLAPAPASAQPQSTAVDTSTPPRTAWGQPDLQGVWTFRTITPLQRPRRLADQEFLSEEEAAKLEQAAIDRKIRLANRPARLTEVDPSGNVDRGVDGAPGSFNNFWWERGTTVVPTRRTSLIVDPPNGRIPPLTLDGQQRADARAEARDRPAASWEDRSAFERCVTRGLPRLPGGYNQNLQILQTPDHVVILYEMMREARVISLDGRPHIAEDIRLWHGDSRGRWESETLVVETRNISPKTHFRGSAGGLHLVERFTRIDADVIDYQVTIDDLTTFTQTWTASIPLTQLQDQLYEYACHEGNHSMVNILSGSRAQEQAAGATKGSR